MQNDKLLPCPFCGGDNVGVWHNKHFVSTFEVRCYDCHFGLKPVDTEEETIEHWNTRKPMERIVEILEEEYNKWADIYDIDKFHGVSNEYAEGKSDGLKYAIDIVERDGIYAE